MIASTIWFVVIASAMFWSTEVLTTNVTTNLMNLIYWMLSESLRALICGEDIERLKNDGPERAKGMKSGDFAPGENCV
jgi:hypothetical protein